MVLKANGKFLFFFNNAVPAQMQMAPCATFIVMAVVAAAVAEPRSTGADDINEAVVAELQLSWTSTVQLVPVHVLKTQTSRYLRFNLIEREICVLKRLQPFPWCPRLLGFTNTTLRLGHAGEPVSPATLPPDYTAQFNQMLADMTSVGVRHNDMFNPRPGCPNCPAKHEVMVRRGRLMLVDFGWATIDGAVPCKVSEHLFVAGWSPGNDTKMLGLLDAMAAEQSAQGRASWDADTFKPLGEMAFVYLGGFCFLLIRTNTSFMSHPAATPPPT